MTKLRPVSGYKQQLSRYMANNYDDWTCMKFVEYALCCYVCNRITAIAADTREKRIGICKQKVAQPVRNYVIELKPIRPIIVIMNPLW